MSSTSSISRYCVVLDLFVINAIISEDIKLYFGTAALLYFIDRKCHRIVLSPSLKKIYADRLKDLEKRRSNYSNDRLFKLIKKLLMNSEKVNEVEELTYNVPIKIPDEDKLIIKTALASSGNTIIITTDRRHLIDNEELQNHLKAYNITILPLDKALEIITKD